MFQSSRQVDHTRAHRPILARPAMREKTCRPPWCAVELAFTHSLSLNVGALVGSRVPS